MTREEFKAEVEALKPAYIQAATDYIEDCDKVEAIMTAE